MRKLNKFFSILLFLFATVTVSAFAQQDSIEPIFSLDLRTPEYKVSQVCNFIHDKGTEFNPTCGRSWKLDHYNKETDEFSFIEIEVELPKDITKEYVLELLQCQRKDPPAVSKMSIYVNGKKIVQGFQAYNGPNNPHYPNENGKPWHLRWDVFEITNELQEGMNKIWIGLDKDTESGISISWIHVRPSPK